MGIRLTVVQIAEPCRCFHLGGFGQVGKYASVMGDYRVGVIESLDLLNSMSADSRIAGNTTAQRLEMVAIGLESLANFCERQIGHTFREVHTGASEAIHDGTGAVYSPNALGP